MNPQLPVRRPAEADTIDLTAVEARLTDAADLGLVLQWLDQA